MGLKKILAYAAIYFLWGGSFLAIRYVVEVIPPFLAAGLRYSLAAGILIAFSLGIQRQPLPGRRQAVNALVSGIALLTISYGVVYWAETRLSSGIVAVLFSTIFLWTYLGECLVLRLDRLRAKVFLPLIAGFSGMPLLFKTTGIPVDRRSLLAGIAVLSGSCLWAATTLAIKKIELPHSYVQTAALQLASSGLTLLGISWVSGELSRLQAVPQILSAKPVMGMVYLVIAASVIGFSAFHWLLQHDSAALVATSSYINPMVAVVLGIWIANERWSASQLAGATVILASIIAIWNMQRTAAIRLREPDHELAEPAKCATR